MRTLQRILEKNILARGILWPRFPPFPWNIIIVGRVAASYKCLVSFLYTQRNNAERHRNDALFMTRVDEGTICVAVRGITAAIIFRKKDAAHSPLRRSFRPQWSQEGKELRLAVADTLLGEADSSAV